jgi:histidyl-tRNA synthetase
VSAKKVDLSVRGTRDFYPEQYARLWRIFDVWRKTATSYGFEEFDSPVLETLELYKIKSGDEIVDQLYSFPDKGGRMLALRPELTPTLARMVAKIQNQVAKPIKWFSIPRCLRYEKPQKGRLREFFQLNVDVIGEKSETADAEVIAVAVDSLINLGLTSGDFVVKINSRDFVSDFFRRAGIDPSKEKALYKIIDSSSKVEQQVTDGALKELGLIQKQHDAVRRYLDVRRIRDITHIDVENKEKAVLLRLFELIDAAGLSPYCELDTTIVRGLDYYTGVVFEIFDRSERMRAICGGGRYNNLLREFSGAEIPACGFGMGDVVLGEILQSKNLINEYTKNIDYFLVRVSDGELGVLLKTARALRKQGNRVEYAYSLMPVKKQMARGSKLHAKKALIFGEEEVREGKVIEKDLETGIEIKVDIPKQ